MAAKKKSDLKTYLVCYRSIDDELYPVANNNNHIHKAASPHEAVRLAEDSLELGNSYLVFEVVGKGSELVVSVTVTDDA